ncbi:MAG TPA: non-homologous end-joining DNA ligase [Actinomycetota bacterium]|nr:non-homologous end-joining DNA ligase [Actinomycetota bacterium]
MKAPSHVEITRPDKLLWPELGITKRAYAEYLSSVSDRMLPWLRDRPLTLVRAPDGVAGERYFQKDTPKYAPSWIRTITIPAPSAKRDVAYTVCNDAATLMWLGNQAALEFHPAPVRRDRLERPDLLVVDIDPPDGAFDAAVDVALLVLDVLDDFGLTALIKTTGGKGLHVVVPIARHLSPEQLRHAATELAAIVISRQPDLVTDEFRKAGRQGRVMLDPSRNGTGATIVAPYSPRARADATVSFPVVPEDLRSIQPDEFTISSIPERLDSAGPARWSEATSAPHQRVPVSLLRD